MILQKSVAILILGFVVFCLANNVDGELTVKRLKEIRQELLYPVYAKDYQSNIHNSRPQLKKDLDFELPFYGFRYNYTRVSMNGYLEFTNPPERFTYPLKFPRNYPEENDPAFIGPFYSKMRIGATQGKHQTEERNGVYFRVESNLDNRTDEVGVETRERVQADIREGSVIGGQTFEPKHVVIATWKGLSFAGGIDSSLYITNTFQAIVATDETSTYVIFNYLDIKWTTHTEAGGDTSNGEGGIPAFVGFNAGQGQRAFEYHPYSQKSYIRDLKKTGCVNGRHVFKVDGKIIPGTCSNDMDYICHLYMDQN